MNVDRNGGELREGMLVSAVFAPSVRSDLIPATSGYLDCEALYDVWHYGDDGMVLSPAECTDRDFFSFRAQVADFRDILIVQERQ